MEAVAAVVGVADTWWRGEDGDCCLSGRGNHVPLPAFQLTTVYAGITDLDICLDF
jgi:hypothetical protein